MLNLPSKIPIRKTGIRVKKISLTAIIGCSIPWNRGNAVKIAIEKAGEINGKDKKLSPSKA